MYSWKSGQKTNYIQTMIFKQVRIQLLPYLIKITAINTVLITAITATTTTGTMILTISKLLSVRRRHLFFHYCKYP